MVHVRSRMWRDGVVVAENWPLEELDTRLADPATLFWIDLVAPEVAVLTNLAERLELPHRAIESMLRLGERPQARRQGDNLFVQACAIQLTGADGYDSRVNLARISAFVTSRGLVTVRAEDNFDFNAVCQQWDSDPKLIAGGALGLLNGLLTMVVDGHFKTLEVLDDRMEDLEDRLLGDQAPNANIARAIYRLRRELVDVRRVISPMRDVINTIFRFGAETNWSLQMRDYYDDLSDHIQRASEWTETLRDLVSSIFETNLALNDARLNAIMKKLSGWAAIIAVPTLITGWFGMNVPYPGYGTTPGFIGALLVCLGTSIALYVVFKKNDWI